MKVLLPTLLLTMTMSGCMTSPTVRQERVAPTCLVDSAQYMEPDHATCMFDQDQPRRLGRVLRPLLLVLAL